MKYTILLTQNCNLACDYCYIAKKPTNMELDVVKQIVDFMFRVTPPSEPIEVGFFGGEPLLAFDRLSSEGKLGYYQTEHPNSLPASYCFP